MQLLHIRFCDIYYICYDAKMGYKHTTLTSKLHRMTRVSLLAAWCNHCISAEHFSGKSVGRYYTSVLHSLTAENWAGAMMSQMVAVLPCCSNDVPLQPFSATLPFHSNPLNTLAHPSAIWQSTVYPPQWQYLHITHITSNLTHAATSVSSNMNGADVNISATNDPFQAFCAMAQNKH